MTVDAHIDTDLKLHECALPPASTSTIRNGRVAWDTLPAGLLALGRLCILAERGTNSRLGTAGSISQAFDRSGNVTSDGRSLTGISGDSGTNTQAFTYDGLNRLLTSSGLATSTGSYEYEPYWV